MGNRMMCVTTSKIGVMQGDASTHQSKCVTTTTPKGGWGGGDAASLVQREVVHDLVPMPPFPSGYGTGGWGLSFTHTGGAG